MELTDDSELKKKPRESQMISLSCLYSGEVNSLVWHQETEKSL